MAGKSARMADVGTVLVDGQTGFYQRSDKDIIDYRLFKDPNLGRLRRGPVSPESPGQPFFSAIGAAQTFGRFCESPYPLLLSNALEMPCYNLGRGGVGPDYFLRWDRCWDVLDASEFVVVQVMSGRSVNNSLFRDPDGINRFWTPFHEQKVLSGNAWKRLYETKSRAYLESVVEETRSRWVEDYKLLAHRIKRPAILFWISSRSPDDKVNYDRFEGFFGSFPQMVNREMIEEVRPFFSDYVELISSSGLPQELTQLGTSRPAAVKMGVAGRLTRENLYYPSPQMHAESLDGLLPAAKTILGVEGGPPTEDSNPPVSEKADRESATAFLEKICKPWMYPRLRDEIAAIPENCLILSGVEDHLFITGKARIRCFTATPATLRAVLEREQIEAIYVLDADAAGLQTLAREAVQEMKNSVPVWDLVADVLYWRSMHQDPAHQLQRRPPKLSYSFICTPRTDLVFLSKVLAATNRFGDPTGHLTVPICESVERGLIDFNHWFADLVGTCQTDNGVFGTVLISDRVQRMDSYINADTLDLLRNQRLIRLHRKSVHEQAVSHYLAVQSESWRRRVSQETPPPLEVPYDFDALQNISSGISEQEGFIDDFVARIQPVSAGRRTSRKASARRRTTRKPASPATNVLDIYYEDLIADSSATIAAISQHIGVDVPLDQLQPANPPVVMFDVDTKNEILARFLQDLDTRTKG